MANLWKETFVGIVLIAGVSAMVSTFASEWSKQEIRKLHILGEDTPNKPSAEPPGSPKVPDERVPSGERNDNRTSAPVKDDEPDVPAPQPPVAPQPDGTGLNTTPADAEPPLNTQDRPALISPQKPDNTAAVVPPSPVRPIIPVRQLTAGDQLMLQYGNSPNLENWVRTDMQTYLAAAHDEFKSFRDGKADKSLSGEKQWQSKEKPAMARSCVVREKPGRLQCVLYVDQKQTIYHMFWKLNSLIRTANAGEWRILNQPSTPDGSISTLFSGPNSVTASISARSLSSEDKFLLQFEVRSPK